LTFMPLAHIEEFTCFVHQSSRDPPVVTRAANRHVSRAAWSIFRLNASMQLAQTEKAGVVRDVSREEELDVVPAVQQNKKLYLENPRPPMLKDYFNDSLHQVVQVPRRSRQIRLQFGVEPSDVPG
jgi:hypothetical protein